ncbi:MAG: hypothetical protein IPO06_24645 [Leptospiraceae bacterium]|nr:hypothetical protein [Leptospiraceae bacterium]
MLSRLPFLVLAIAISINCLAIKTPELCKTAIAKEGVLDLREWNFAKDGKVTLDGEWEVFPEKLESSEIQASDPKQFFHLGNTIRLSQKPFSYASFKLRILLPEVLTEPSLYLRAKSFNSAYAVFEKEKLIAKSGTVGKSKLDSIPWICSEISPIQMSPKEMELTLKVSDFYSTKNTLNGNLELGTLHQLESASNIDLFLSMILASLFLLIFFYNISQIKEKVSIALAISALCLTFLVGFSDSYPLSIILPNTVGKFLLDFKIISQFLVLVCTTYLYFVLSSGLT